MTRREILLLSAVLAGCVFRTSDAPRYFRPESAAITRDPQADPGTLTTTIRLRTVRARPLLRERIVWRMPMEYGMYEQRRWSELPETYVERAVASALKNEGIGLSDDTRVPALSVEVTAFDEVVAPTHFANVAADVVLTASKGRRLLERAFAAESPIADDDPRSFARSIGAALDDASAQVARAVAEALRTASTEP